MLTQMNYLAIATKAQFIASREVIGALFEFIIREPSCSLQLWCTSTILATWCPGCWKKDVCGISKTD